jgi:hypothetical protein
VWVQGVKSVREVQGNVDRGRQNACPEIGFKTARKVHARSNCY